jgi:FkbM family methyltransferase
MTSRLRRALHQLIRRSGFDVVRYPLPFGAKRTRDSQGTLGDHLMNVFERAEIECVLDVGAHRGEYGRLLREYGYDGHIVSFEPVAANAQILREHARLDPNWTVMQYALGATHEDDAPIHVSTRSDLASFRSLSSYGQGLWPENALTHEVERVEQRRLDNVLVGDLSDWRDHRLFLKIDTQGWEGKVMTGAGAYLDRILGMQVEVSVKPVYDGMTRYLETLALLETHGLELTGIFPVMRDPELRIVELDCVLIRSLASRSSG